MRRTRTTGKLYAYRGERAMNREVRVLSRFRLQLYASVVAVPAELLEVRNPLAIRVSGRPCPCCTFPHLE